MLHITPSTFYNTGFCGPANIFLESAIIITNLTSPGFPALYPDNLDCHWVVVAADDNYVVVARVLFFHLEKGFDYLTIGDGGDVEDKSSAIASLTGSLKVSALASSISNMWMALTTDSTGHLEGYRFELEQMPATDFDGNLIILYYVNPPIVVGMLNCP